MPHLLSLAWKYGGLTTFTAANPAIPEGGFVGESKSQILDLLPPRWTIRGVLIAAGDQRERLRALDECIASGRLAWPLVLKPDAGQRGVGVRLVANREDAARYLREQTADVLAQRYHPGPFEAGIFYYRMPGERRGRIFSITEKVFPVVTGDGRSTLEDLVLTHPRYRLQADVFLQRHADDAHRVLPPGERFPLTVAGNHCQGTMFRDGAHLWTPRLEARVDEIARHARGFYVGRFDVRYTDPGRFMAGEDLAIVELNGVTSESTNIYDPDRPIGAAWRILADQWRLVFEIGARNRRRGAAAVPVARLARLAFRHLRSRPVHPLAT